MPAGKIANAVISYLDLFLRNVRKTNTLVLSTDNTVSQNKNNAAIAYLSRKTSNKQIITFLKIPIC